MQEIKKKQKIGYAFKFQIHLKAFLEKVSFENNKLMKIDVWFPRNTYTVLDSINIRKKINTAIRDIYKRYDSFVQRGSALCENTKNKYRKSKQHDKIIELLPFDNMEGPVSIREIKYLERKFLHFCECLWL